MTLLRILNWQCEETYGHKDFFTAIKYMHEDAIAKLITAGEAKLMLDSGKKLADFKASLDSANKYSLKQTGELHAANKEIERIRKVIEIEVKNINEQARVIKEQKNKIIQLEAKLQACRATKNITNTDLSEQESKG